MHEQIIISRQYKTTNDIRFKYNPHNYLHDLFWVKCTHINFISIQGRFQDLWLGGRE
jgi:hypothetical protein